MTELSGAILKYILDYKKDHDGNSPSYEQMSQHVGGASKSVIHYNLKKLEEFGYIRLLGGSRGIVVRGGEWRYSARSGRG
jgi:SOS-response transcriptional repressor LexA